ncbi:hypothetical protein CIHG_09109 [Coccidioides immitis H538.4]|uniref:Uncharacterized protein n=1 Tax=Coccidioides immitis H538.4 TaxID=396776 RepID=A0A0J8S4S0_COCIT|nr:hypothetical protein CIHG_09109 [Coccidioides immitis H538.4]
MTPKKVAQMRQSWRLDGLPERRMPWNANERLKVIFMFTQAQARRVAEALETGMPENNTTKKKSKASAGRKRKVKPVLELDDDDSEASPPKRRRSDEVIESDSDGELMVGIGSTSPRRSQTPPTSADNIFGSEKSPSPMFPWSVGVDQMMAKLQGKDEASADNGESNEDEGEDVLSGTGRTRRRAHHGRLCYW